MANKHTATPFEQPTHGFRSDEFGTMFTIDTPRGSIVISGPGLGGREGAVEIVNARNAHDDLVGFAQFVLRGIKSGHVSNASFIDHDLSGEEIEVETLSSYAAKVLAKAGAA